MQDLDPDVMDIFSVENSHSADEACVVSAQTLPISPLGSRYHEFQLTIQSTIYIAHVLRLWEF